jgi:hypothetical protein
MLELDIFHVTAHARQRDISTGHLWGFFFKIVRVTCCLCFNMKRSATDDIQSNSQKRALSAAHSPAQMSPPPYYSNASPASITSASPQYTPQHRRSPRESRKYIGCSRISEYELDDKLGEGTFGYAILPTVCKILLFHSNHSF